LVKVKELMPAVVIEYRPIPIAIVHV
jgi:hypothetical protein